jgi:hypothetical protein
VILPNGHCKTRGYKEIAHTPHLNTRTPGIKAKNIEINGRKDSVGIALDIAINKL